MGDLSEDTALEVVDAEAGEFRFEIARDWEIWGPNGGYMAVVALRAAGLMAKVQRPAAFSGHFLSVGRFEEARVHVTPLKVGRRAESFSVSIEQGGRPLFHGMVRTAGEGPGLVHDVAEMPDVLGPESLQNVEDLVSEEDKQNGPPFPFWNNFEVRPVWPERVGGDRKTRPAYAPVFREWFRFIPRAVFDDPWLEAGRCLLMIDTASWIAASQPHPNPAFTAPNIDVSAWFHQSDPASEWLLTDTRCDIAADGLMGTHAKIWSQHGKLLATGGAQLLCVPNPPEA